MLFQVSASWNIHSLTNGIEWGIPSTRGGNGMNFPDRGTRAVMKIFQPEAGGRGLENSLQPECRGQENYSMPDSGQWNTIPINITEILDSKNLCHSNSEVKNLGMKIPTRVKTYGIV